ncbi:hypothetical protein Tco_0823764 [Tanacetum coccineum]|uniref:Uncharacterized protein n=1 Tax=Tanacetum coccineum TaxID=301880 RepID=A0ABQ5AIX5_9ASTR
MYKPLYIINPGNSNISDLIVTIPHNLYNLIITKSGSSQKLADKIDELRALSGYVLGAARVQVPKDNLYDMRWTREEDGEIETLDPQFLLGSELLEGLGPKMLGGSTVVEVILVIGQFVLSIVKVRPIGKHLCPTLVNTLPVGFHSFL